VREFAPDLPLLQPMTQQEQFEKSFSEERLFAMPHLVYKRHVLSQAVMSRELVKVKDL
jgi:hypothetical protein